jgi:hypothetical protein
VVVLVHHIDIPPRHSIAEYLAALITETRPLTQAVYIRGHIAKIRGAGNHVVGVDDPAKLDAAKALGVDVVMIRQQALPGGIAVVSSVQDAAAWVISQGNAGPV